MRLGGLKWALSYAHIREQGLAPTNTRQGLKFLWPCIRRSLPLRANSELAGGLDQARALTFRRQECSRGSV